MADIGKRLRAAVKRDAEAGFVSLAERPMRAINAPRKPYYPTLHLPKPIKGLNQIGKRAVIELRVRVSRLEAGLDGSRVSMDILAARKLR